MILERTKYGFIIINNETELNQAKENKEKFISIICQCCQRPKVIEIDQYNKTCEERKQTILTA